MSDVPRFACFGEGMLEGYDESWVRSSDYDALRAERDTLAKENAALRTLLAECRPSMVEHRKRVEQDLTNAAYFPGRYPETLKALNTERDICDALLDRIDAAVKS